MMKRARRYIYWRNLSIALVIFAGFFFLLGFFYQYHLPRLKAWLLVKVERLSAEHSPIRVWPKSVDLTFFPPGISLKEVRLLPQGELKSKLAPTTLEQVDVSLSVVGLFKGRLRVGEFRLKGGDFKYIDNSPGSNQKFSWDSLRFNLDDVYSLPLDLISLENIDLWLQTNDPKFSVQVRDLNLSVENSYRALLIDVATPQLRAKKTGDEPILDLSVDTKLLILDNRLQVSALKIKKQKSYVIASGTIYGRVDRMQFENANLQAKSHFRLNEVVDVMHEFFPETKLPPMSGVLDFGVDIQHEPGAPALIHFDIGTQEAVIDGYDLGNVAGSGKIKQEQIEIDNLTFRHSSGHARISKGLVKVDTDALLRAGKLPEVTFQAHVATKALQLQRLLSAVKVGQVPVRLEMEADLPCQGKVIPTFEMKCNGTVQGKDLSVTSGGKEPFPIVDIESFSTAGEVSINSQAVTYKANLKIGESVGASSGHIAFAKGFNIQYEGEIKDFNKEVKNLARLKLEGSATIKGSTEGDSRAATFEMDLKGNNIWLEDFGMGQFASQLRYKSGILTFKGINGHFGTSQYNGSVSLNFGSDRIFVSTQIPYLDASDLQKLLSRRIAWPVAITGTGAAKAKVYGPFQFNQLSFDLESSLFRGTVANESYDKFFANAKAENGLVTTQKVELYKGSSRIDFRGQLTPKGHLDAVMLGKELRLEQSENLVRLGINASGQLDVTMSLRGPVLQPEMLLNGRISKVTLAEQPAEDSRFQIQLNDKKVDASARLLGEQLSADLTLPLRQGQPLKIKMSAKEWKFTQLFSVFSSVAAKKGFETLLTADVDLNSPSGDFWQSSGLLTVDKFLLRRGPAFMQSPLEPMRLRVNQGEWRSENFRVMGESSFMELLAKPSTRHRIDMQINGKVDLTLASLLAPFMDDLRGTFSFSSQVKGSVDKPQLLGSAYVQQGLVKLKGFPHAFEDLRADLLFSQNNVLINALKGKLGGGELSADGRISFNAIGDVPIDIKGRFDQVSLNVPQGFKTQGSGQIYVKGHSFPYELGGRYEVMKTQVNRDFSATKAEQQTVRPSTFLPKFLGEEVFQPIALNLDIELMQPAAVKMIINNADIEAPVTGRVRVKGNPEQPLLSGRLNTGPPGRVTFRNNVFDIRTGQVEYVNSPPEVPNLYLAAETRVKDSYDVTLNVQGSAKNPRIELNSQPPLPEHEIVSLLALGFTSQDLDKNEISAQDENTKLQIGSALIKDQLGLNKKLQQNLGLDVDISSVHDRTTDVTTPAVSVRYQWSPKFGVSASQTIGDTPKRNFKSEYKFNRNWSVLGEIETKEDRQNQQSNLKKDEKLRLDLEYKVEFK